MYAQIRLYGNFNLIVHRNVVWSWSSNWHLLFYSICDECNYGSYQGRCVICGAPGVSDAYYCKECVLQEKDVSCRNNWVCKWFIGAYYFTILERWVPKDCEPWIIEDGLVLWTKKIWFQEEMNENGLVNRNSIRLDYSVLTSRLYTVEMDDMYRY